MKAMMMMPHVTTTTTAALQGPPPERGTCGKGEGIDAEVVGGGNGTKREDGSREDDGGVEMKTPQ